MSIDFFQRHRHIARSSTTIKSAANLVSTVLLLQKRINDIEITLFHFNTMNTLMNLMAHIYFSVSRDVFRHLLALQEEVAEERDMDACISCMSHSWKKNKARKSK